jgi:hypothetical protein
MTDAAEIERFALAGNARLTLVSVKTGQRFSYRIRVSEGNTVYFVSVLTGSDNENDYTYLGVIDRSHQFRRTAKSRIGEDEPSHLAFEFFWRNKLHPQLEVWHEGRCGRCARALTVPESIAAGIGPDCAQIMGI